jgi:integrase
MFRVNLYKDGKNNYRNIGPYPEVTLTAAKTKHKKIVAEIHLGTFVANPTKEARQPTVGEVFQAYLTHHQFNPEAPKADARKVQRQFERFVFSRKTFCRLDATDFDVENCVPVIRAAMEAGNTTGNNLLRNAKAAINWGRKAPTNPMAPAEFSHWRLRFNPFAQMQLQAPSNPQDERYLSEEELATAYSLLEEYEAPIREMLRFVFLSGGIRLRQLNRLTWDDIDQKQMTMRFYDKKGRRPQPRVYTLPLTELMLETLHRANPGDRPVSNGGASPDEPWLSKVSDISKKMGGKPFSAKHIRKTGWSLMRTIPVDAKRYWLSDDMSGVAQKHYDFFDHRDDILQGMLQWQAMCEGYSK